jgi:hypothetical protein
MENPYGVTWRYLHNQSVAGVSAWLEDLYRRGVRFLAIVPHEYTAGSSRLQRPPAAWRTAGLIFPDIGQDPTHPFENTPDLARLEYAVRVAQSLGMTVLLKPHIDPIQGGWRGYIATRGLTWAFTQAYRDFITRYVRQVAGIPDVMVCLGCELWQITTELGPEFLIDLAQYVRHDLGFTGPLTYAANWGNNTDAEVLLLEPAFRELDYVGVDAYYPVADHPAPTVDEMVAGWHEQVYSWMPGPYDLLTQLADRVGKPLMLTEVGCGAHNYGPQWPWAATPQDAVLDPTKITFTPDQTTQANYYRALNQVWPNVPRAAWEAWDNPATDTATSLNIIGREAEGPALRGEA